MKDEKEIGYSTKVEIDKENRAVKATITITDPEWKRILLERFKENKFSDFTISLDKLK